MRHRTAGFQVFNVRTGQIAVPHGEIRDVGRDFGEGRDCVHVWVYLFVCF